MILLIISVIFIIISNSINPSIHLHTHKWCPTCRKIQQIFIKLQQKYPQIAFQTHSYTNKTILHKKGTEKSMVNNLPFPTLIFNCSDKQSIYQNDPTFNQLSYWIEVQCLHKIPTCTNNINQDLFHIAVLPRQNQVKMGQKIEAFPHIKICSAKNANYTQDTAIQILQKSVQRTLFLDYFNHNVRNYLIKSKKMALALITNNVNTTKASSFFNSYLSLENFMDDNNNITNASSIFRYKMKEEHKSQLVFLGLCYNSNLSKCVSQSDRYNQVASSQKNIAKLLDFINLEINHLSQVQYVVAFRFNFPKFQSYIYHENLGILDQKFIFWIDSLLQSKTKKVDHKQLCVWNSIVHRVSDNSLEDIETHTYLIKKLDWLKQKFNEEISVTKLEKIYHNDPKMTVCLTGQIPQSFESNQQISQVISAIESSFTTKVQKQQNQQL